MSLLRPRVRDDRGRTVRLVPFFGATGARLRKVAAPAAVHALMLFVAIIGAIVCGYLVFGIAGLAWQQVLISDRYRESGGSTALEAIVVSVIIGLGVSVLVITFLGIIRPYWRGRAIVGAHRLGACACCGYDLRKGVPEPDGCTLCPECGAAWRLQGEGTKGQRDEGTEGDA